MILNNIIFLNTYVNIVNTYNNKVSISDAGIIRECIRLLEFVKFRIITTQYVYDYKCFIIVCAKLK